MKIVPTPDGQIRIDIESPADLEVLSAIAQDAYSASDGLADRLAGKMAADELTEDWNEFVLPDLSEQFNAQLARIGKALKSFDPASPKPLYIEREAAEDWYGGLNQARLALEHRYHFAEQKPEGMEPKKHSAWFRNEFYGMLQWQLMEFLMLH